MALWLTLFLFCSTAITIGFFLGVWSTWKSIDQSIKFGAMLRKGKAYEITLIRKIS